MQLVNGDHHLAEPGDAEGQRSAVVRLRLLTARLRNAEREFEVQPLPIFRPIKDGDGDS